MGHRVVLCNSFAVTNRVVTHNMVGKGVAVLDLVDRRIAHHTPPLIGTARPPRAPHAPACRVRARTARPTTAPPRRADGPPRSRKPHPAGARGRAEDRPNQPDRAAQRTRE